jgi:CBS domain containing-hemolysin-like protein
LEDPEPSLSLLGIVLCLLILAFTSAVDAAFTTISRHRLNALLGDGRGRSRRAAARLIDDPYHFKSTVIFVNTSTLIIATGLTLSLSVGRGGWAVVGSLGALLVAALVVGEVIPKALAVRNPTGAALMLAGPMSALANLLWPLIALVNLPTRPLYRLLSGQDSPPAPLVTEEELRLLVNVGEEEGLIEHEERAMIEGVIAFGDTLVREIMVPRVDIVGLDLQATLGEALDQISASGHSRIPVYDDTIDTVVGILYAKDVIPALRGGSPTTAVSELLRTPHFVPETMKVGALMEDLQRRKVHMAIIVDEYGGTAGLATIEDLIEQIVGEIQDEYDTEDPSVQPVSEHEYIVDTRVLVEDLNDLLGLALVTEDAERIGGLVYERLGRVPRTGDVVDLGEATATVLSVKGVRAQKLRIVRHQQRDDDSPGGGELLERGARGPT